MFRRNERVLLTGCLASAALLALTARPVSVHADGWHAPPFVSSPYEYWDDHREELGFPKKVDPAPRPAKRDLPVIEDLEKARADYGALLKRFNEEKQPARKEEILEVLRNLSAAIQNYEMSAGGQRPLDARRKAFVHQLIAAAAYTNDYNLSLAEFGWVLQNRDRFMREIVQILREIGPEAAAQLWEHLRSEVVFFGEGQQGKAQARQEITRLEKEIREIRAKQARAQSREMWESLEGHIKTLQEELGRHQAAAQGKTPDAPAQNQGAPLTGARSASSALIKRSLLTNQLPYDTMGLVVGKDYVEFLVNALVGIGPAGLKHWKHGLWDPNPQVRAKAIAVLKALGLEVMRELIDTLEEQKDAVKQTFLGRALEELSGQKFGTNVRQWDAWWKQNKPLAVPPGPGQAPLPPGVAPPQQPPPGGGAPQFPGPEVKLPADGDKQEAGGEDKKAEPAPADDPLGDGEAVIKPRE